MGVFVRILREGDRFSTAVPWWGCLAVLARRRRSAYNRFLQRDGSLEKLDAIGAGKADVELTLLRSQMDEI